MANKYLDEAGLTYFWSKLKDYFQQKLVSGTNIKTINSQSILGSGDLSIESHKIQKGYASLGTIPANSYADVPITFDSAFSSAPTVVVSLVSTSTSPTLGSFVASPINVTANGFSVRVFNNTSSSRSPACTWIAVL